MFTTPCQWDVTLRRTFCLLFFLSLPLSLLFAEQSRAGENDAKAAIQKLKELPQWKHLDESIVDEIARVPRGGPRVDISVEAVSPDGKPVAGALVVVFESASALLNAVNLSHEHPDMRWLQMPLDVSVTDEQGKTVRTNIRTSRHVQPLSAGRPGYAQLIALVIHPDWGWSAQAIATSSGPHAIKIVMLPTAKITGRLNRPDAGKEVDSFESTVLVFSDWSATSIGSSSSPGSGTIDPWKLEFVPRASIATDGSFEWFGLPASGWIRLNLKNLDCQLDTGTEGIFKSFELNGSPLEVSLKLRETAAIQLRVIDAQTKEPVPGCIIPKWTSNFVTDEQGMVTLNEYQVYPVAESSDRKTTVSLFPTTEHVPFHYSFKLPKLNEVVEIELDKGVQVNGRVVDSATKAGVQDVELVFSDGKDQASLAVPNQRVPILSVTSDVEGKFAIVVPKNTTSVNFRTIVFGYEVPLPSYMYDTFPVADFFKTKQSTSIPIRLDEKSSHEIELPLRPVTPLTGIVLGADGKPQADVEIDASLIKMTNPFRFQTKTDSEGKFQIRVAPNLKYDVTVVAKKGSLRTSLKVSYNSVGSFPSNPVVLKLTEKTSQPILRGRILMDDKPVKNASVVAHAYRPPANRLGAFSISFGPDTILGTATTDEEGVYSIELNDVEDSSAIVRIQSPEDLAMNSWNISPVALKDGETRVPDMNFKTKYGDLTISGEILSPEADPIQGATISAIPETRVDLIRRNRSGQTDPTQSTLGVSDENGNFECKNLGEGKIQLQIRTGATSDFWASQVFQSVMTTADKKGLIVMMDPKLSVPPMTIEPTKTGPISLEVIHQRYQPIGTPVAIKGRVVDENDSGVDGVAVFVIAAKPSEGLPMINPFLHPLCGFETKTNPKGEFELTLPVDSNSVRLAMSKPGFQAGVTDFLDPSKVTPIRREIMPQKKGASLAIVDSDQSPIANALLLSSQSLYMLENTSEFVADDPSKLQVSDADGSVHFASSQDFSTGPSLVIKPGYAAKIERNLGRNVGRNQILMTLGSGLEGRVVDENGPVVNYTVCCSTKYGRNFQRTKTDAQGVFRFEGINSDDQREELLLFGDPYAGDLRGWLKTHMLFPPEDGKIATLPDLQLESCRILTVNLNDAAGNPIKQKTTLTYRLRQNVSIRGLPIELDGSKPNVLVGLPSEPLILSLDVGRGKTLDIQPPFQRVGFELQYDIGLPMEQDIDLYYTILPQ
jgi:hypothetical protein